eukprot:23100-Eustigmatos_ZCMA.PRE.1
MSSLHLQLRGKYFICNCKSSFHMILRYLVTAAGRSFVRDPTVFCMDNQPGKFRICGVWNGRDHQ